MPQNWLPDSNSQLFSQSYDIRTGYFESIVHQWVDTMIGQHVGAYREYFL